MEPNPYQSPQNSSDELPNDNRLIRGPGILSWILVIALLPTPLVGGVAGLMIGLMIGFQFFEVNNGPPLPDLSETGWWLVLACGVLGFLLSGVMMGLLIRRLLNPIAPA